MPIDPSDYDRLLYSVPLQKTRRMRKVRWLMAMIVLLIVDFGMLAVGLSSRSTSAENAEKSGYRSNAVLRMHTLRTRDTLFESRRLPRADL